MRLLSIIAGLAVFALGAYLFVTGPVYSSWFTSQEAKSPTEWTEVALEIIKLLVALAGLGTAYYNFRHAKNKAD